MRGAFHGINEHVHLHTLPGVPGGVINVFNLTDEEQQLEFDVPMRVLGTTRALPVKGAGAEWSPGGDAVRLKLSLAGMCPAVIEIGEMNAQ